MLFRSPEVSTYLLACGAQVSLGEALVLGQRGLAQALLVAGADLRVHGRRGETLLMLAAEREYPELVRELLRRGQNVNAQDDDGFTALSLAVSGRHVLGQVAVRTKANRPAGPERLETVRMLMAAGADVRLRAKDWDRCTAVEAARETGQTALARLLRRAAR